MLDDVWLSDHRFSMSFIWSISAVWAASIFLAKATASAFCRGHVNRHGFSAALMWGCGSRSRDV